MQVGCVLTQWAKTSPFRDESGGLSFMTEAEITRNLNRWLDDTTEEMSLDFDLPVKRDLVKKALSNMYTDQLHCGERHGLQKSSCGSATHWSIAFDLAQRASLHSNKFEREVQKQVYGWLDPGTDTDVRAVVEALTPARSSGPKPTSVVQVAFAIAGSCASAPDVAVLLNAARLVVSEAQQRQVRITSARPCLPYPSLCLSPPVRYPPPSCGRACPPLQRRRPRLPRANVLPNSDAWKTLRSLLTFRPRWKPLSRI